LTGKRGDIAVIDDPHAANDLSAKSLTAVKDWYSGTLSTRFNDPKKSRVVLIMQRLHTEDLSSYLDKKGFEVLELPSYFEPGRRSELKGIWADNRAPGELLFPERFSEDVLARLKLDLGSMTFAAQHQHRPVPADGGLFKREWLKHSAPLDKAPLVMTVDPAFTGDGDRACALIGQFDGHRLHVIDGVWGRLDFTETVKAILQLKAKWPKLGRIYVEAAANGHAIINVLKGKIPGVIPLKATGSKEARAAAASPFIEAGNVTFDRSLPFFDDAVVEMLQFPRGTHDDFVDTLVHLVNNTLGLAKTSTITLGW
jgi:predicted phage terminase large subunit-like protein